MKKAKKSFKFKSKVIVWKEGYNEVPKFSLKYRENRDPGLMDLGRNDKGAWRFARVPEDISAKIKEMQKGRLRRGWGAVYAKAKIKKSEWVTSIFPDRHLATYILPLKKQIRYQENLYDGTPITVSISIWF